MGCAQSTDTSPQGSPSSSLKRQNSTTGVQDDARSFRSKHSAIKMLTKNKLSCQALTDYLKTQNKVELLTCYMDLEEIRQLTEEQALTRASALVWRYKTQFESVRKAEQNSKVKSVEVVVWECLGRLRYVDGGNIESDHLLKMINNSQNDLLSKLILPFEGFLNSKQYKAWQDAHVQDEKLRRQNNKKNSENSQCLSPSNSIIGGMGAMSVGSARAESVAADYSNVLIVDDSLVTLKLTRLTLEKDGHNVDKALNGQIALDMLKQRIYDVVLIDLNMPVMDGFETIRLFREYEQGHLRSLTAPIPKRTPKVGQGMTREQDDGNVSDLSDDEALTCDDTSTPAPRTSRFALEQNNRAFGHGRNSAGSGSRGAHVDSMSAYQSTAQLIIGMSTDVDSTTRKRALDAGMDYFLPKPFTLHKFTEIIRSSIEKNSRQNSMSMSMDHSVSSIPIFNQNSLYSP